MQESMAKSGGGIKYVYWSSDKSAAESNIAFMVKHWNICRPLCMKVYMQDGRRRHLSINHVQLI